MDKNKLVDIAQRLVAGDKGLLAMDESKPTCDKRFKAVGVPTTEEARRAYREMIVTTPHLGDCISGAILFDETVGQSAANGRLSCKFSKGRAFWPASSSTRARKTWRCIEARRSPRGWTG